MNLLKNKDYQLEIVKVLVIINLIFISYMGFVNQLDKDDAVYVLMLIVFISTSYLYRYLISSNVNSLYSQYKLSQLEKLLTPFILIILNVLVCIYIGGIVKNGGISFSQVIIYLSIYAIISSFTIFSFSVTRNIVKLIILGFLTYLFILRYFEGSMYMSIYQPANITFSNAIFLLCISAILLGISIFLNNQWYKKHNYTLINNIFYITLYVIVFLTMSNLFISVDNSNILSELSSLIFGQLRINLLAYMLLLIGISLTVYYSEKNFNFKKIGSLFLIIIVFSLYRGYTIIDNNKCENIITSLNNSTYNLNINVNGINILETNKVPTYLIDNVKYCRSEGYSYEDDTYDVVSIDRYYLFLNKSDALVSSLINTAPNVRQAPIFVYKSSKTKYLFVYQEKENIKLNNILATKYEAKVINLAKNQKGSILLERIFNSNEEDYSEYMNIYTNLVNKNGEVIKEDTTNYISETTYKMMIEIINEEMNKNVRTK